LEKKAPTYELVAAHIFFVHGFLDGSRLLVGSVP